MQAERSDSMSDEEVLIKYIDIPYFRNNPSYIDRWRQYYFKQNRDPQILLLMHHKQISTYFHWLYLELSGYFLKIGKPEIASLVLNEALKIKVYDESRIKKALSKVPSFEKHYSRGDLLAVLNQRNIRALGTVWNCFEEEIFYVKHLPEGFANFEIKQMLYYENKYGENKYGDQHIIHTGIIGVKYKLDDYTTSFEKEGEQPEKCFKDALQTEEVSVRINCEPGESNLSLPDSPFVFENPIESTEEQSVSLSINLEVLDKIPACSETVEKTAKDTVHDDVKIEFNVFPSSFIEDENEESKADLGQDENISSNTSIAGNANKNARVSDEVAGNMPETQLNLSDKMDRQKYNKDESGIVGSSIQELKFGNLENKPNYADEEKEFPENSNNFNLDCLKSIDLAATSEDSHQSEIQNIGIVEIKDKIIEEPDTNYKIKANDDGEDNDLKKIKIEPSNTFKTLFQSDFLEVNGELADNSEIIIDKYIYLIQSLDLNAFYLLRLAKDADVTQTMIGKYFILKEASPENVLVAKSLFNYSCCKKNSKCYVLFEHSKIAHLSTIIAACSPTICLFYLRQIIGCLINLRENDITVSNPLDFFIGHNFVLALNSFDFLHASDENIGKIERDLAKGFKMGKIEISSDFLAGIDQDLSTNSAKKEILNHKTWILENL